MLTPSDEWAALCRTHHAAKATHDKLFGAICAKFATRPDGSVRAGPYLEEIMRAESTRRALNDIEKEISTFLRKHV